MESDVGSAPEMRACVRQIEDSTCGFSEDNRLYCCSDVPVVAYSLREMNCEDVLVGVTNPGHVTRFPKQPFCISGHRNICNDALSDSYTCSSPSAQSKVARRDSR